jgi:hypothetical protein
MRVTAAPARYLRSMRITAWHESARDSPMLSTFSCVRALMFTRPGAVCSTRTTFAFILSLIGDTRGCCRISVMSTLDT